MYSPVVATARLTRAMDAIRLRFPSASAETVPSADHLAALDALWTPHPTDWKKGERVRDLTEAEAMLIEVEIAKAKCDFRYWLAHYARIKDKDARSRLVTPLLDSQEMMIRLMGTLEEAALRGQRNDGILIAALKARQVGLSTLTELALLHRTALYGNLYALIAADVEEQSANLFDMTERALRALPWWMRPRITNHVKDSELNFGDIDSLLRVTFANTTRGGTQIGFEKGQLGRGSAQPLTAKVLTPDGWRQMGELRVGDLVIGSNGRPTPVLAIYPQGKLPTYRLTMSDGASTVACGNHLWTLTIHHRPGKEHLEHTTQSTRQLLDGGLRTARGLWKYELPLVAPVTGYSHNFPLHPYVLGALLGDGGITCGRAHLTTMDAGVLHRFQGLLPDVCRMVDKGDNNAGKARTYRIISTNGRHGRNPVTRGLRALGLMGTNSYTKFIPECYMAASPHDRLEILRGLMDTDGWVCDGQVGFCSTSEQLARDVQALVRSLGGTCGIHKKPPSKNSFNPIKMRAPSWQLRMTLPHGVNPFGFSRKSERYDDLLRRPPSRRIRSIEPTGLEEECQCIYVAADDHLYVTDDYILTHNTPHLFHGSEMSTWSNPGQVDDALLPAIPKGPNTLAVLESTARGRNWWYRTWLSAKAGDSRWVPLFIPWYAEARYRDKPPTDWVPLDDTLKHAIHAEAVSHRWMGQTVRLDREQLYFWEKQFLHAKKERKLFKFLAEYAADDEDCFRVSDDGFFDGETLLRLRQSAHPPLAVLELV